MVTSCPSFPKTSTQRQESTFSSTAAPTALQVTRNTNMVSGVTGVISKQLGHTSVLMSFLKELPTRLPSAAMATPQLTGTFKTTFFSGRATSSLLGKTTLTSLSSHNTADSIGITAKGRFSLAWNSSDCYKSFSPLNNDRLNRPAVNAVQWRHSLPENRVVILIGWLSKHSQNYV